MTQAQETIVTLSPKQVERLLLKAIPNKRRVLVTGAPGVAKSAVITSVCKQLEMDIVVSHPAVEDATESSGIPWPIPAEKRAEYLLAGQIEQVVNATRPTLWFVDDLGQGPNAVQAAYMQWLLARECHGKRLPDCVTMIGATNRRGDRAGVTGVLETVKSRFHTIIEMAPVLDDWCEWAYVNGIHPMVIAFLRYRPGLLWDFKPSPEMTNSPSPRGWHSLSDLINDGIDADCLHAVARGAVGEGAATEFVPFCRVYEKLQDLDAILLDPMNALVPEAADALYATAVGLGMKATKNNIGRVIAYGQRMHDAMHGDQAALLILTAFRKTPEIQKTPEWGKLAASQLGRLILGQQA